MKLYEIIQGKEVLNKIITEKLKNYSIINSDKVKNNSYVKGRIERVAIEDFNNDGFPDMIMYSHGGVSANDYVTVYAVLSAENKSFTPVFFPDILDDAKLRDGYKGHDEFTLMEGMIMRTFPVFKPDDTADKPTGGKRTIQYKLFSIEGGYRFKVIRTFELKQ